MKSINTYCRGGIVCLFSLFLAPTFMAVAQQNQNPETYSDEELYDMDLEKLLTIDIVTASKLNLENESLAAGVVTVIAREEIVQSGARNLEEVLRTVAGFDIIRTSFTPNTMVVVRGLHSTEGTNNKILFLIDGHPFRSVFYGDATVFAGNIALNNVAKIEIIRGPGSTLFGTGAFLGVVNIVTHSGEHKPEASLAVGSFGSYELSASGSFGSRDKKFRTTLSANHFSTDGPDLSISSDIARELVDPYGQAVGYPLSSSATPGKLNYARKTSQANLNSTLGKFYLHSFIAKSQDAPPVGPYDALTSGNDYTNTSAFAELGVKLPMAGKKGELLIKSYYDYAKLDQRQTLWSPEATQLFNVFTEQTYPAFGDMLTGPPMYYSAGEGMTYRTSAAFRGVGTEATLAYNLNNKVKFIAGTMYEGNRQFGVRTFANGNIFFEYDPAHFMYIGDRNYLSLEAFGGELDISADYNWNRNANRNIFAAYAQAEVDLVRSLHLKNVQNFLLTVGGRYDHYSDAGKRFNPRAALVVAPHDKLFFKALYGTAFRAPSFSELYTTNNSITLGDPTLKPETVVTYEFVAGYRPAKNAEASVTYFNTHVKNNIQLGPTSSTGLARQYANIGQIETSGVEASLRYKPSGPLSASLNFTVQHVVDITHDTISAILESSGERVTYRQGDFHPGGIPKYIANASLQYALTKSIGLGVSANYVGERIRTDQKFFEVVPGSSTTTGNLVSMDSRDNIPARLLLSSSVRLHSLPFARGLEIQLSGFNLTDTNNYNEAGGIGGDDLRREGVNWMARASYKF